MARQSSAGVSAETQENLILGFFSSKISLAGVSPLPRPGGLVVEKTTSMSFTQATMPVEVTTVPRTGKTRGTRGKASPRLDAAPVLMALELRVKRRGTTVWQYLEGRADLRQAYRRGMNRGTMALEVVENFCDLLGCHPFELYGSAYDESFTPRQRPLWEEFDDQMAGQPTMSFLTSSVA